MRWARTMVNLRIDRDVDEVLQQSAARQSALKSPSARLKLDPIESDRRLARDRLGADVRLSNARGQGEPSRPKYARQA